MLRRKFLGCAIALAGTFLLQPHPAVADVPLKVGLVVPLSGPVAMMGTPVLKGLQLFQEEHPEAKSSVQFIVEDSQYDGKTTTSAVRKLLSTDKVDLIYVWGNTPGEVAAPIVGRQKVPGIFAMFLTVSSRYPSIVEFGPSQEEMNGEFLEYLRRGDSQAHDFGAITVNLGSALVLLDLIDASTGSAMPREVVPVDTTDFKSVLVKFQQKKLRKLVLMLMPDQALTLLRQAKELNYDFEAVGGDIFADDEFARQASHFPARISMMYGAVDKEFRARYFSKYHNTSFIAEGATGYSFGMLAQMIAQKRGDLRNEEFSRFVSALPLSSLPNNNPHFQFSSKTGNRIATKYTVQPLEPPKER